MKHLLIALFLISAVGCQKQAAEESPQGIKDTHLNRSLQDFKRFADEYQPSEIDISKNESLSRFDVAYILESGEEVDDIVYIILLKQYLFHLGKYHQGYDLLSMRKGQAKHLVNYFLEQNHITGEEFVNSAMPYVIIKAQGSTNKLINDLLMRIEQAQ